MSEGSHELFGSKEYIENLPSIYQLKLDSAILKIRNSAHLESEKAVFESMYRSESTGELEIHYNLEFIAK